MLGPRRTGMRVRFALPTLLFLVATGAAESAPRDVGPLLQRVLATRDVPSLAGAIVSGGRLEAQGAVGVRVRGRDEKVTVDDRWHLGSCTKSMTATLVAMLVEDGKLSFETPV